MIQAEDFLEVAEKLIQTGTHESHFRTAISRAYYACYHLAHKIAVARLHYAPPSANKAHWALAEHMINEHDTDISGAGDMLRTMHRLRIKADYRLSKDMTANEARLSLIQAKMFISIVKGFR